MAGLFHDSPLFGFTLGALSLISAAPAAAETISLVCNSQSGSSMYLSVDLTGRITMDSGTISISGRAGDYSGECEAVAADAAPKF